MANTKNMNINARTRFVSLLGYPLGHSLSPEIHNTSFQAQGINLVYLCMQVHPDNLVQAVLGFKAAGFVGSNVTIPHKQAVFQLVDELSEQARAVGAVNTIVCKFNDDGEVDHLFGDNTDIKGFLEPLDLLAQREAMNLAKEEMLIFGSGGAARAVAYAMLTSFNPSRLTMVARTPAKAAKIAEELASYDKEGGLKVVTYDEAGAAVRNSRLLVNATPLGMHKQADATPWHSTTDFGEGQIAYDLIYNPQQTRFMKDAAQQGALTLGGLDMLIEQAAASYYQWTGREMPRDVVHKAVMAKLANH